MKLLPSQCTFCAHHTTMHQFTVLFEATYYIYVCLAVTCHLYVWQNDHDLLHATAVTWGVEGGMDAEESAQKVDPGEENSPTTPDGT